MAGYIGSKASVTQVDGYNTTEADAEFVQVSGDTMSADGATVLTVDRATSDGTIIDVQKNGTSVGSIGNKGTDLYIGTGDVGLSFYDYSTENAIFPHNPSTNSAVDASIDLGRGVSGSAYRFKDLYLSGGVYLGGTTSSNKLDDYEEGTWTPVMYGVLSGITLTSQEGTYTKIGNVCHCSFRVVMTVSSPSGANLRFNTPFSGKSGMGQDTQGGRLQRASALTVGNFEDYSFGVYNQTALYLYDLSGNVLNYASGFKTGTLAGTFSYFTT